MDYDTLEKASGSFVTNDIRDRESDIIYQTFKPSTGRYAEGCEGVDRNHLESYRFFLKLYSFKT